MSPHDARGAVSSGRVRKALELPVVHTHRTEVLGGALLLGAVLWILDASLGYAFFDWDKRSFLDVLVFHPPQHALYARIVSFFTCALGGLVISRHLARRLAAEGSLRLIQDESVAALRERDERLRIALAASKVGVWTFDFESGVVTWTDQVYAIFGVAPGTPPTLELVLQGIHPDDRAETKRVVDACRAGRLTGYERTYRTVWPDGTTRWVDAKAQVLTDAAGLPIRLAGAINDITERKRAQQALETAMHVTARATGRPFFATVVQELARAFGVRWAYVAERGSSGNARVLAAWDGAPAPDFEVELTETAAGRVLEGQMLAVWRGVREAFPKDARLAALGAESFLGAPIFTAAGVPVGLLAVLHDAPKELDEAARFLLAVYATRAGAELERIVADEEIRGLNARLERRVAERTAEVSASNAELQAFAYSVSHDLRAPLRAIDGFARALSEDSSGKLDSVARGYIERVLAASSRMDRLIDDLLGLSRVARTDLDRIPVDLEKLARSVALELAEADRSRSVAFDVAPGLSCHGDPGLLGILVTNLLGNAWKFTSKTAGAAVSVGVAERDGEPAFFVRDNGAGFDPTFAERLFAPFQRLHPAAEFPGNGIGLATVQRIVTRHGGRIWAEGKPGAGATFFFTLPVPEGAAAERR
jgi:PAS domain S-box-containing protein